MDINLFPEGRRLVVSLAGDFDLAAADPFRRQVDRWIEETRPEEILLDLSRVGFLDSSGLGAILGRYRRLSELGARLRIRGHRGAVAQCLAMSGVSRIVELESAGEEVPR